MAFSLAEELTKQGIPLDDRKRQQFEDYFHLLVEWNERMNLTAITDYDEVMEKHFYDSITPAFFHNFLETEKIADIGSGAGFPSLPLKILYPHLQVTIIDSLRKRLLFLETVTQKLQLEGVTFIHGRAEEVARKAEYRDRFPFVMARAVARLPVLVELCLPFVEIGGSFLALKGGSGEEEVKEAKKAISTLGGKLIRTESFTLPIEDSTRTLIWIQKEKGTPKAYPRKPGTPNRSPIL